MPHVDLVLPFVVSFVALLRRQRKHVGRPPDLHLRRIEIEALWVVAVINIGFFAVAVLLVISLFIFIGFRSLPLLHAEEDRRPVVGPGQRPIVYDPLIGADRGFRGRIQGLCVRGPSESAPCE